MSTLGEEMLDGWVRTKVDKSTLDPEGFVTRPFCSLCNNLVVKCPVSSPKTGKTYCSNKCMKIGDAKEGRHMEPKEKKECECGARFESTDELVKHKKEGLCSACRTEDDKAVEKQVEKETKKLEIGPSFICGQILGDGKICQESFATEKSVVMHRRMAHNKHKGEYKCPKCQKTYKYITPLKNHLMKEHHMKSMDAVELIKKAGYGSKVRPANAPDILAIEKKEKTKTSYDEPKPVAMSESHPGIIIRARTVGFACVDCGTLWELEINSKQPKYCPECGRQLQGMTRRSIKI